MSNTDNPPAPPVSAPVGGVEEQDARAALKALERENDGLTFAALWMEKANIVLRAAIEMAAAENLQWDDFSWAPDEHPADALLRWHDGRPVNPMPEATK